MALTGKIKWSDVIDSYNSTVKTAFVSLYNSLIDNGWSDYIQEKSYGSLQTTAQAATIDAGDIDGLKDNAGSPTDCIKSSSDVDTIFENQPAWTGSFTPSGKIKATQISGFIYTITSWINSWENEITCNYTPACPYPGPCSIDEPPPSCQGCCVS